MAWDNAVVTNAGVSLLKDVLSGGVLTLDYAAGGAGTVAAASLMAQTTLKEQKQQFTIVSSMNVTNGKKIKIQITNLGLTAGYTLNQIGIWAHVDSGAPVLFAILQDGGGIAVPAESELVDFVLSFYAVVNFSNEAEFSVTVDSSALVSMSTLTEALKSKADLGDDGKIPESQLPAMDYIPTSEKGAADGVAELDESSKVPVAQLPIGSTSQYGALKVKEGNGLTVIEGVVSLQLTEVAAPAQEGTLTYNGSEQSPSWGGYDTEKMTISGITSAADAGTYTVTFSLLSAFKWDDGSTGAKSVTWTIERAAVATPSQSGTLTYTGAAQSPSWSNYSSTQLTIGGTTSATNAGSYTTTFTPTSNFKWSDGTTVTKSIAWTIAKATGSLSISPTSLSIIGAVGTTSTITVTRAGDGAITATSSNASVATVSVSGTTVTVKSVASGSATITVAVAAGTNHTAPTSKTCPATITAASVTFNEASWADISAIAKAGIASSLWSIGDEKNILLSTGETLILQIYDFNHDDLANGSGKASITFGMKNLMETQRAMNSTGTNAGSFTGSELYTWLTDDLWNSLPSELQAVIQPVSKSTSAGSQSTTIKSEGMSVFLFSEIEVFGTSKYSAAGEGILYPIFTGTTSRIKHLSNDSSTSGTTWWLRSPFITSTSSFENVNAGYVNGYAATVKCGIAFGFCI